jgi:hypothetical protein
LKSVSKNKVLESSRRSQAAAAWIGLTLPLAAFTPVLTQVDPPGGQAGTEVEVGFAGERLGDITGALFYEPGLTLANLLVKDGRTATAKIAIAADAAPGEHSLRLAGPGGVTELRTFWVGAFPTVRETEPNNSTGPPQKTELNRTIHGIAENEDDDCFSVTLKKGQRLSAEVEAMRLGRTMFDASLAILDSRGFELATCDDTPLLRTDAFVSILAPEDGDYRVIVREAAYEGNNQCQYRLHIGNFPRPKAVFPTGGKPGETLEFTFIGDPAGPIRQSITLPPDARADYPLFPQHDGLTAPSPHWITVSPLESARDNDASAEMKTPAQLPPPPCAAQGVVDPEKPSDWFRFSAKKDRALVIRAIARAHRSPLDPLLSIHAADGNLLAANDDQGAPDSILPWTCPGDGDYLIQIRDQLHRTGPDFTYRIEIADRVPAIAATLPVVERVNSQKWKTFPIPRGNRYAAVVNLTRENTACDAVFEAVSLPQGVTLHSQKIPRSGNNFLIVLEAAADAPEGSGLHAFRIRSEGIAPPLAENLTDTIHHIDINNQGHYHSATFDRIATVVTREAPFKVELDVPPVPIVKNGTLSLKVRAVRQPGFTNKITTRFLWSPPGISGPVTLDIPGDKTEADYEIHASADAAPGDWQVCVLAEADTPAGPVLTSSAPTPLKIAEPYVAITLDLAATEPAKPTSIMGKIEHFRPFTGSAKADLSGLPQGVATGPVMFTAGQTEITFPLQVAADARTGKHSGLFCVVAVPENNSTIFHQTGMGGTLRIDPPSKTPDPPAAKPATAAADAKPAPAKPLSRLEQLRQKKK